MATGPPTTRLGDHRLNRIGLGTNRLTDTAENRSFLKAAVAAGVDLIDTAHGYTGGGSEATIGATVARSVDDVVIGTKGGYRGGGPRQLRAEIEQSLERLQVDTITLYYLHRVDPEAPLEDSLAVLAEYRDAGRILHVGLSEVSVEQIERARAVVPIAAVQNEYSLSERHHEDVVDFCGREGLLFVPYFPLRGSETSTMREVASRHAASPHQIKLAWLLKRSPTMLPIPGTLSLEHLKENLRAMDVELSDDDFGELSDPPA
jgi:aryl-alcohol dehydrogenase-like predicted oxidoreductase